MYFNIEKRAADICGLLSFCGIYLKINCKNMTGDDRIARWKGENRDMDINEEMKIYMQTIGFLDESTNDYLYIYDMISDRIYFTDKICEKYPLPAAKDQGIPLNVWGSIVYSRDLAQLEQNLADIKNGISDTHDMEYRLIDREGNRVWVNCRGNVHTDEEGRPRVLIGSVSELAARLRVDDLTGLQNYDKYIEDMGKCLADTDGYLMVLGIDDFKHINVKNGRVYGNRILKMITEILEEHSVRPMKLYRMAGDCFAVDFPQKSREDVLQFYTAVKQEIEKQCTVSAGVVPYEQGNGMDGGMIYQYAENALDRAKKEGKNTLIFFSSEDYQKNLEQIRLLDEIKTSVREGYKGFFLCYQPQITQDSFVLYGAEALLRYQSDTRGLVGPGEFIPLLEQSGLICEVGLWALRTAVRQCVLWRKKVPDFHINVNISYVQLREKEIEGQVLELLQDEGLPGEALTLEVTESIQLRDYPYFNRIFHQWKRNGIQIAIDDFGTGYSSLSYLKSIDIDEAKIDRCFVTHIQENAYHYRLLSNMIELAHSAQIRVCCEGVETTEELAALKELKPDVLQGFLFAKPCLREEFERLYLEADTEEYKKRMEQGRCFRKLPAKKAVYVSGGDQEGYLSILEDIQLGLWRICMNEETGSCEMYADAVMRSIMGLKEELSPKDCYAYWYNRISEGYYNYVEQAVEQTARTGRMVQIEYTWNHPKRGAVTVRCAAVRRPAHGKKICLEGYHRIISDLEIPDFLPNNRLSEQFEYNEKKQAIYFHTKRRLIAGDAIREQGFPDCWIREQIVHPHFAAEFKGIFKNVQEKEDERGKEMLFLTKKGNYEWFKLKAAHLSHKQQDAGTIAVIMEPADHERAMELEYMKKSDFYEALLSDTVAHAEVDVESGHIMKATGVWETYGIESREERADFDKVVQKQVSLVVYPEDEEEYRSHLNLRYMKEMYKKGVPTMELCFRRYVGAQLYWMKLVLHVFQDRYTENMYALLYLKNIDAEKKRELAQENAATRDPLTNVYNRTAFETEVKRFMNGDEPDAKGALIILDLDDFKQVNDRFGHLKGDETLKFLAEILKSTFRSHDAIGRLGGDEFLVFVKGTIDRSILDKRMGELLAKVGRLGKIPLSCSAGIRLVGEKDFNYNEDLRKADVALYASKKLGKNCYSYYEEQT